MRLKFSNGAFADLNLFRPEHEVETSVGGEA